MLTIATWLWGSKYSGSDVEKLAAGVRRHLKERHRFICLTDHGLSFVNHIKCHPIQDGKLLEVPGCFARLRMFDPEWQKAHGIDDRLVCMDLDTVITGNLDPLFDRPEPFLILQGGNSANPCPYGGALMMLRPGVHPELWLDFSLEKAAKIKFHEFPDDQGWIWHKVPNAAGWKCGPESGVYVFRKPGWPLNDDLPRNARLVTFNGWRAPHTFRHLPWVSGNWKI